MSESVAICNHYSDGTLFDHRTPLDVHPIDRYKVGIVSDLTDAQWAFIEPIIPPQEGPGRPREVNLRRVIDALQYLEVRNRS